MTNNFTHPAPVQFTTIAASNGRQIGMATLHSEKTMNALSMAMIALLGPQLQRWEDDPSIALVVLQGAGEKAFCAGGDLRELYRTMREHHASERRDEVLGNDYARRFFEGQYRLDYQIHTYAKPMLCWGHGIVLGGGVGLMAGASHRVVTEQSRLGMPEVAIGLAPDVGSSWFFNRMPGKLGLFLGLTGAAINAADALFVKLADYHLPHASKAALMASLQAQDWSSDEQDNHGMLSTVLHALEQQHPRAPAGPLRRHVDLINRLCSAACLPEIITRITTLGSDEACLQQAAAALKNGSPTAAWLAHAMQQHCRHLSLADVFRQELVASLACASGPDFTEGIRALLIDKDRQPNWQSPAHLERHFSNPWTGGMHPLRDLGQQQSVLAA